MAVSKNSALAFSSVADHRLQPEGFNTESTGSREQSRYSVTDYFEKYPEVKPPARVQPSGKEKNTVGASGERHGRHAQPAQIGAEPAKLPTPDVRSNIYDESGGTSQQDLYKGTELDTSLSTIRGVDDVRSIVTSCSTMSIDDREFRQELEHLDANIARIQASLKQAVLS